MAFRVEYVEFSTVSPCRLLRRSSRGCRPGLCSRSLRRRKTEPWFGLHRIVGCQRRTGQEKSDRWAHVLLQPSIAGFQVQGLPCISAFDDMREQRQKVSRFPLLRLGRRFDAQLAGPLGRSTGSSFRRRKSFRKGR